MFFTNLPLRYIEAYPNYLALFLQRKLCPELGLDAQALDQYDTDWHKHTAEIFHAAGLRCAIHLPFFDLHPGSLDTWARKVCVERLIQAISVARIYNPAHCIAHLDYNPLVYAQHEELWLQNSLRTWNTVLDHTEDIPVFLENVHEQTPEYQCRVLQEFGDRLGACFDIGHWHSFGRGRDRANLCQWLDMLAPWLGHLHLHDNDGTGDQHLGLGLGTIPWDLFSSLLHKLPRTPSATLEPHTEQDFLVTDAFLTAHPDFLCGHKKSGPKPA